MPRHGRRRGASGRARAGTRTPAPAPAPTGRAHRLTMHDAGVDAAPGAEAEFDHPVRTPTRPAFWREAAGDDPDLSRFSIGPRASPLADCPSAERVDTQRGDGLPAGRPTEIARPPRGHFGYLDASLAPAAPCPTPACAATSARDTSRLPRRTREGRLPRGGHDTRPSPTTDQTLCSADRALLLIDHLAANANGLLTISPPPTGLPRRPADDWLPTGPTAPCHGPRARAPPPPPGRPVRFLPRRSAPATPSRSTQGDRA